MYTFDYIGTSVLEAEAEMEAAEVGAEAIFENQLEAEALVEKKLEAEAIWKKIWVEAEVEANFFSSWKRKWKLLNSFWRVEAEAEAVKNFWKFYSAFYV